MWNTSSFISVPNFIIIGAITTKAEGSEKPLSNRVKLGHDWLNVISLCFPISVNRLYPLKAPGTIEIKGHIKMNKKI